MSEFEDLLAELCPNGVEHRPLGEVGTFIRGNGLQKKDFTETGVGCIHYGQIYTFYGTAATSTKSFVSPELAKTLRSASPGDLIVTTTSENVDDVGKAVAWLGSEDIAIGGHSCAYEHSMDPLYAAYLFQTGEFNRQKRKFAKGTKVKEVSAPEFARIVVPVPPREVQIRIAKTLRAMEGLEADLETELEAEMEARRRQYEYYRDSLLSFHDVTGDGYSSVTLGEVGRFVRGRRFIKSDAVPDGLASIHYGEIYTHYGVSADSPLVRVNPNLEPTLRFAEPGDVVIAAVGETVEDVGKAVAWLGDERVAVHDDCFTYTSSLNPKYVAYFFQTRRFNSEKSKYVNRAKVKRISSAGLSRLRIPQRSDADQAEIVSILDAFDALATDLSSCLPAEITARRKQYEYYRDKLLTFEQAS